MRNLIISLKPKKGAFHIGDDLKGLERVKEYIHSDTLFSGLIQSFARLYGKKFVDDLINKFSTDNPPFVLSSGFLNSPNEGYFFPKPKFPISILKAKVSGAAHEKSEKILKKYKETRFLPDLQLKRLLEDLSADRIEIETLENAINEADKYSLLFYTVTRPSSSIDRVSSNSELFFRGETFLKDYVTISVFCKCNESYVEEIKQAFECLGDFGIGGERTYGLGQFSIEFYDSFQERDFIFKGISTLEENEALNNFAYLLSLYYPADDDELNKIKDNSFYSLIERKGWFDSPYSHSQLKRKSIMMFEEGSIIGLGSIKGCLVDVSPDYWKKSSISTEYKHKILRNGLAFFVPFKYKESI